MYPAMSVVAGQRYSGAWDDGSYRYDLVLGFTAVDRKHNVEGTTEWTHRSGLGDEKAGKSTVLEQLIKMPLFPRKSIFCTRMPIQIQLRRQTRVQMQVRPAIWPWPQTDERQWFPISKIVLSKGTIDDSSWRCRRFRQ